MKYTVISAEEITEVVSAVNALCDLGWEPHGNLVMGPPDFTTHFYQPMVNKPDPFDMLDSLGPLLGSSPQLLAPEPAPEDESDPTD